MEPSSSTVFEELQLVEALRRSMDPEYQVAMPTAYGEMQPALDQPERLPEPTQGPHVPTSTMGFNDGFLDCSMGPNAIVGASKWVVTSDGRRHEQVVEVHTDERGQIQERHAYERIRRQPDPSSVGQHVQGNTPTNLPETCDQADCNLDKTIQAANHETAYTESKQPDNNHLNQAEPIAVPFPMTCALSPPRGLQSILESSQATLASLPTTPVPVAALQPPSRHLVPVAQQKTPQPSGFNPQQSGQSRETTWSFPVDHTTAWAPPTACWPTQPVPARAVAGAKTTATTVATQDWPPHAARMPAASPCQGQSTVGVGVHDMYKVDVIHGLHYSCSSNTSGATTTNHYPRPIGAGAVAAPRVQNSTNTEKACGSSQGARSIGPGSVLLDPQRPVVAHGTAHGVINAAISGTIAQEPRPSGSELLSIFTRPD